MKKALIITSALEHDLPASSPELRNKYDILVTTSFMYKHIMSDINVSCDTEVTEDIRDSFKGDYMIDKYYYSTWNGGRCNYFITDSDDMRPLPFQNNFNSGCSAILLMAYYGCGEIVLSKGSTLSRIDGRAYTYMELRSYAQQYERLKEILTLDWGYQTFENSDQFVRVADKDESKINQGRWITKAQEHLPG